MSDSRFFSSYTEYISLGAEIAAGMLLPILLGYWLDSKFDTSPWLVLGGCAIGVTNVLIIIFRLADRLNNKK